MLETPIALMSYTFCKNWFLGRLKEDAALCIRKGREGSGILSSGELPKSSGAELAGQLGPCLLFQASQGTLAPFLLSTQPKRAQGHKTHSMS